MSKEILQIKINFRQKKFTAFPPTAVIVPSAVTEAAAPGGAVGIAASSPVAAAMAAPIVTEAVADPLTTCPTAD